MRIKNINNIIINMVIKNILVKIKLCAASPIHIFNGIYTCCMLACKVWLMS